MRAAGQPLELEPPCSPKMKHFKSSATLDPKLPYTLLKPYNRVELGPKSKQTREVYLIGLMAKALQEKHPYKSPATMRTPTYKATSASGTPHPPGPTL